jgi:membrane associated rhomboid family serine protease
MSADEQTCYRHPSRETGVSCSSCGRPICPDCMTPTPVGMRCPECSKQKTQVKTLSSMSAAPTVTMVLIAVNVIAFLASGQFGFGSAAHGTKVFTDGFLDGPDIHYGHDYWRLVTSGFLHVSLFHIGFNMYLLYMLGQMLEPVMGNVRFGLLYFVALLCGSAGALALSPDVATVGASGAVFGLMGAAFFELRSRGFDPFAGGISSIGGLIVLNLIISFSFSNISLGGHIGGLIGGSLVGIAFHEADKRRQPLLAYGALVVIAIAAVAASLAVAGNTGSILG